MSRHTCHTYSVCALWCLLRGAGRPSACHHRCGARLWWPGRRLHCRSERMWEPVTRVLFRRPWHVTWWTLGSGCAGSGSGLVWSGTAAETAGPAQSLSADCAPCRAGAGHAVRAARGTDVTMVLARRPRRHSAGHLAGPDRAPSARVAMATLQRLIGYPGAGDCLQHYHGKWQRVWHALWVNWWMPLEVTVPLICTIIFSHSSLVSKHRIGSSDKTGYCLCHPLAPLYIFSGSLTFSTRYRIFRPIWPGCPVPAQRAELRTGISIPAP